MTYPFSNGDVLQASDMNAVGLHLITPSSVTGGTLSGATVTVGSAVSTVTVSGVFSADFDNYRVLISGIVQTTGNYGTRVRIGSLTTGYYGAINYLTYTGTSGTILMNNDAQGYGWNSSTYANSYCTLEISNPFGASYTMVTVKSVGNAVSYEGGFSTATGSQTDLVLFPYLGTWTGGTIRVYGYSNG